jgi:hypothetical protein
LSQRSQFVPASLLGCLLCTFKVAVVLLERLLISVERIKLFLIVHVVLGGLRFVVCNVDIFQKLFLLLILYPSQIVLNFSLLCSPQILVVVVVE